MTMTKRLCALRGSVLGTLCAVTLLAGCGPRASEARLAFYPPREQGCSLEMVKVTLAETMEGGPWELIGHVYVSAQAKAEPFAAEYLALVRPRACAMGGEAFGILMAATNDAVIVAGSTTDYIVVRKRPSREAQPQQPAQTSI
jgi:hypothetical protein